LCLPPDFVVQGQTRAPESPAETPLRYDDAVRRCIERALSACKGQIYGKSGAAALLGLKPTTLQSKMRKLGIAKSA
jgi:transcriptional regulator with GAF, ATPase, and Fis domain